jgi:uncharacterized protein YuzE
MAMLLVVTYSAHAEQKLLMRNLKREDVARVIANPNEVYEDIEHNANVAIGSVDGKALVVIYQSVGSAKKVITVYHALNIGKLVSSKTKRGCLEENPMKVHYDREQDILYLAFKEGPSREILESSPNIILELDENKEIMGLEIWNAKKTGLLQQVASVAAGS